jgi:DNA-binding MarR family transcriptional regulator
VRTTVSLLLRAARVVEMRLDGVLEAHGLSVAKLRILRDLSEGPLPLGALAQRQACVRSNITQLIDRMEAEGLVSRIADPTDRRVTLAEITESGQARYSAGLTASKEAESEVLSGLSADEIAVLGRLLQRVEGRG